MQGDWDTRPIHGMAAAALAGALHFAAIRADASPVLCLVALVPLMMAAGWDAAEARATGTVPRRRIWSAGLLYGGILAVGAMYWTLRLLPAFYGIGTAKILVAATIYVSMAALGRALVYAAMVRAAVLGWSPSLTAGPFLVCFELLYPRMPPEYLGASLAPATAWVQMADLGGPLLLTLWVAAVNGLVLEVGMAVARRGGLAVRLAALATLLVVPALYGAYRTRVVEAEMARGPGVRVGAVQPDRPMRPFDGFHEEVLRGLQEGTREVVARGPVDLLLWPESAPPSSLPADLSSLPEELAQERGGATLVFGAVTRAPEDPGARRASSAFLVSPDGAVQGRYDKIHRMPFGEYIPLGDRLPWLYDVLHVEHMRPGLREPLLAAGPLRLGMLICYEDILPDFVRGRVMPTRPNLLINLTNDGWFFETPGAGVHMRLARLRAIEHHRYLVRATNHGISAVVDPLGRIVAEAPPFVASTMVADVALLDGVTAYAMAGDWPGWLALLLAPWLLVFPRRRARSA